jgi:hypothetical protein
VFSRRHPDAQAGGPDVEATYMDETHLESMSFDGVGGDTAGAAAGASALTTFVG